MIEDNTEISVMYNAFEHVVHFLIIRVSYMFHRLLKARELKALILWVS